MSSAEAPLPLAELDVSLSMYEEEYEHEMIIAHCDTAAAVLANHLRKAKLELMAMGINVNWREKGL